jgi:hypothetical protein
VTTLESPSTATHRDTDGHETLVCPVLSTFAIVQESCESAACDAAKRRLPLCIQTHGRSHWRRIADLLIAATPRANGLELYMRNPDDFAGPDRLVPAVGL